MGSRSHGGERKGQLGPAVTVPMSSVGSESAPHFYKSPFGSWVRGLMEAKEKGSWDLS